MSNSLPDMNEIISIAKALRSIAPRLTAIGYLSNARQLISLSTRMEEVFALGSERLRARQMIERLCEDPEMWGTHGQPGEAKLNRLEMEIAKLLNPQT